MSLDDKSLSPFIYLLQMRDPSLTYYRTRYVSLELTSHSPFVTVADAYSRFDKP